jgi:uncharacterized protein with LGFP repeats
MRRFLSKLARSLRGAPAARAAHRVERRASLQVESLEDRRLMSISPTFAFARQPTTAVQWLLDPIQAKYQALGGTGSILGASTSGEMTTPDGSGLYETYQNGAIFSSATAGTHYIDGPVTSEYLALAGKRDYYGNPVQNLLGLPTADQTDQVYTLYRNFSFFTAGYRVANFQGGSIYWMQSTGAHVVYGGIGADYAATASQTDAYGNSVQGILGYPTGDETDVPGVSGARMQTFQGGAIYWSAAGTGAHAVFGAIGGDYAATASQTDYYGNSVQGILGVATGDETDVPGVTGARMQTFQNGTIYWTPDHGAHALYGGIGADYAATASQPDAYGNSVQGILGVPISDETDVSYAPGARMVTFQGGTIYWTADHGAHALFGGIGGEYTTTASEFDANGHVVQQVLGVPTGDETDVPGGRMEAFQGGTIYWSYAGTGAHAVIGAIGDKYNEKSGPYGFLGLPTTDEIVNNDGVGRHMEFTGGTIYWTADLGAHSVDGLILGMWSSFGREQSLLGYPVSDEYGNADGFAVSDFQNGSIVFRNDVGTHLSFSRGQLLGAINASEQDGVLDAGEFAFLQEVANDPNVYMTDANHNLLQKMIDGNVADAFFQGTAVGNLYPGAPSWMVEDLKQKWFEGADLPYASNQKFGQPGYQIYGYAPAAGPLFGPSGPSMNDVRQGLLGDCYFVGSLEAVALKHPDIIQSMITDNGDGTFTVRFYKSPNDQPGTADYVTVNRQLPVDQYGNLVFNGIGNAANSPTLPVWADLIEKAYAQVNEENWTAHDGTNSYNGIPGTTTGGINGGHGFDALNQITNWNSSWYVQGNWPWSGGNFADDVGNAYRLGLTVVLGTPGSVSDGRIAPNHQYVLLSVSPDNQTFVVANPWGHDNVQDAAGNYTGGLASAITVLTRDQFIANFNEFDDA